MTAAAGPPISDLPVASPTDPDSDRSADAALGGSDGFASGSADSATITTTTTAGDLDMA